MNDLNLLDEINIFQNQNVKVVNRIQTVNFKELSSQTKSINTSYKTLNFKDDYNLTKNDNAEFANMFLKYYFKRISKKNPDICLDDMFLSGMPRIKGTRIPVTTILSYLYEGEDIKTIMEDFNLRKQEIASTLKFSIDILNGPYYNYDE